MKRWLRLLAALLCLSLFLSAVPTVLADTEYTEEFVYGPALESPLNETEKQELMAALYEADVTSVRDAIRAGYISCQELTAYYLARIEAYEDPYNCIITVCDNAMEEAKKRDADLVAGKAKGDLFGVPIMVKDNIKYKGYHTTNGTPKKASQISTTNAFIVQQLLDEGVVVLAKTNMCEWAYSASHSSSRAGGITKNAYNTYMAPGGSSGGSAVATSLNLCVAALGTDTNSSLRMPSALNGCVSMRVTHGSISRAGITTLNSTRDVPGVITRSVGDLAIMMDAITGKTKYAEKLNANALEGARIGIIKQLAGPIGSNGRTERTVDKEVVAAFQNAVEELRRCGAEVVEISISSIFSGGRESLYKTFKSRLEEHDLDAVIYPTYLSTPQKVGKDENGKSWSTFSQTWINNCHFLSPATGCPEITVPIGNHSRGPSIGMEIAALKNQEQLLLDLAYSYTLRYDHRTTPAGAPNDYAQYSTGTLREVLETIEENKNPTWLYSEVDGKAVITGCSDTQSETLVVPTQVDGLEVAGIAAGAFSKCSQVTTILLPQTVSGITAGAFDGCEKLKALSYAGTQEQWNTMEAAVGNLTVVCGYALTGDYNADLVVDEEDALYLLRYTLFADEYPLPDSGDYNGDSIVSYDDALRLYWYSLYPESFPLAGAAASTQ